MKQTLSGKSERLGKRNFMVLESIVGLIVLILLMIGVPFVLSPCDLQYMSLLISLITP